MEVWRQTTMYFSSWNTYFRRSNKSVILHSLIQELFSSYDPATIQDINRRRMMAIIRHIGRCMRRPYTIFGRSARIRQHLRLTNHAPNQNDPYIMFILNIIYISYLYSIAKKTNRRELHSLKTSVDNLITIYKDKVDTNITPQMLNQIANILINSNLVYYRPAEKTLIDELDELLENSVVRSIPTLHILLHSVKLTILHM